MTRGGVVLQIEEGLISPTIRAQMGGHPPIVMLEVTDDEKPRATSD